MEHSGMLVELKRGGPRNLFLVHDGHGATLVYSNLARRMPNSLTVFGVEPRRISGIPLAHTCIEDMASFYIKEMRKIQPHGPYLLGGLCAGGIIAYEMALQLVSMGERIELLALLEAATPQAPKRRGPSPASLRLNRALADAQIEEGSFVGKALSIVDKTSQELISGVQRKIARHGKQVSVRLRVFLLHKLLVRQRSWPRLVPELTVNQVYASAVADYVPRPLSGAACVVLVRARRGKASDTDTPYRKIFADETMGWGAIAQGLIVVDVEGGHWSMLQEPFVQSLAAVLMPRVGCGSDATSSSPFEPEIAT
jgi:thioesterase domain-containing protein